MNMLLLLLLGVLLRVLFLRNEPGVIQNSSTTIIPAENHQESVILVLWWPMLPRWLLISNLSVATFQWDSKCCGAGSWEWGVLWSHELRSVGLGEEQSCATRSWMVGVSPWDNGIDSSTVKDDWVPSGCSVSSPDNKECADELFTLSLDRSSTSSACACSPSGSCDLTDVLSPNTVKSLVEPVLGVPPLPALGFGVCCPLVEPVLGVPPSPASGFGACCLFGVFGFWFHVLLFSLPILTLSPGVEARSGALSAKNGWCLELSLISAEVRNDPNQIARSFLRPQQSWCFATVNPTQSSRMTARAVASVALRMDVNHWLHVHVILRSEQSKEGALLTSFVSAMQAACVDAASWDLQRMWLVRLNMSKMINDNRWCCWTMMNNCDCECDTMKVLECSCAELSIQDPVQKSDCMALPSDHSLVQFNMIAGDIMTKMNSSFDSHQKDIVTHFRALTVVIEKLWALILKNNGNDETLISSKEHLLWALHCMKQAPNFTVLCKTMKTNTKSSPTKKTVLKWVWFCVREISTLKENVILWENRKTNDCGDDCLVSDDCIDCMFQQMLMNNPEKQGKKMVNEAFCSHEIDALALQCEIAVSLLLNDVVWINGPLCPGNWNDLETFSEVNRLRQTMHVSVRLQHMWCVHHQSQQKQKLHPWWSKWKDTMNCWTDTQRIGSVWKELLMSEALPWKRWKSKKIFSMLVLLQSKLWCRWVFESCAKFRPTNSIQMKTVVDKIQIMFTFEKKSDAVECTDKLGKQIDVDKKSNITSIFGESHLSMEFDGGNDECLTMLLITKQNRSQETWLKKFSDFKFLLLFFTLQPKVTHGEPFSLVMKMKWSNSTVVFEKLVNFFSQSQIEVLKIDTPALLPLLIALPDWWCHGFQDQWRLRVKGDCASSHSLGQHPCVIQLLWVSDHAQQLLAACEHHPLLRTIFQAMLFLCQNCSVLCLSLWLPQISSFAALHSSFEQQFQQVQWKLD